MLNQEDSEIQNKYKLPTPPPPHLSPKKYPARYCNFFVKYIDMTMVRHQNDIFALISKD